MLKMLIIVSMLFAPLALAAQDNARACGWESGKWVCRDQNDNPLSDLESPADVGSSFQKAFDKAKKEKQQRNKNNNTSSSSTSDLVGIGNLYFRNCPRDEYRSYCYGYTRGLIDGLVNGQWIAQFNQGKEPENELYCIPETANVGQIIDIFVKYLKDNPEKRHFITPQLMATSLQDTFPCQP